MEIEKVKILAIDDNKDNLFTLKALIKETFPEVIVITALSGKEGIEIAELEKPHLILLDVIMPKMDGFEVCKILKGNKDLRDIPIVFVTALGAKENRIQALESGGEGFLTKPIDESELEAQIRVMLKIRIAAIEKLNENERLEKLVKIRTQELRKEFSVRQHTEEALEKSEGLSQSITQTATDAIICINSDGLIRSWNLASEKIFGYTSSEMINNTLDKIIPNQHKTNHENGINRINNGGKPKLLGKSIEIVALRKDGTEFPIELSLSSWEGVNKQKYYTGIIRDITHRKLAKDKLENSEERLSQIIENSKDWIWEVNIEGIYTYSSNIVENILGYTSNDLVAKKYFYDLFHEDDREKLKKITFNVFKQKKPFQNFINRNVTKSGEIVWISSSGIPILNNEGNLIGYRGADSNITKRVLSDKILKEKNIELSQLSDKLTEKNRQLLDSKNKFKKLFDKSPVSIIEQDFSEVIKLLNKKKAKTSDIEIYLNENPSFVKKCVSKIEVKNVNEITLSLLGVENLEELKIHFEKTNSEKSFISLKNELASIALGKKDFYGETEFIKSDGTILHALIKSTMIDDNGRNIASIINITDRKKAEEELLSLNKELEEIKNRALEGEESYKALFKSIGDAIYIQDYDAKFIDVNSGVLNMYGYSKEELIGNTPLFLSAPDMNDMPVVFESFEKVKQGFSQVFEFWGIRKNGEIFPKTVGQFKGTYFGQDVIITVARDISNQIKTQQELILAKEKSEEGEEKLKLINTKLNFSIQNMPTAYILWDTNLNAIEWNKSAETIFQFSYKEIIGNNPIDFIVPKEARTVVIEVLKKLKSGESANFSAKNNNIRKDGSYISCQWFNSPLTDENGKVFGIQSIALEITEQLKASEELQKAKEKAEESDKLKSAFLANMSHEIRTPMNGILGFSELLKTPNLSGDEQQKYIRIIEKSGKRMLNIINDIVDVSKIEVGLMNVDINESNINEQIEYIYTFFKPEVEANGMQLFFKNTLPDIEAIIKTDREKLFAILTNLVKNAIKYTSKGSIEFGYVLKMGDQSVNQSPNTELEFYIKDTGIGIPKDRQKAIFERFIQADIEDKMARQGAGLGLSITKSYIEMLGGKIWVESEEGIGSTFYFTLPYNTELKEKNSTKEIEITNNTENHGINLKILIAEDDEVSEMLISINVSEFGKEIIKATTGTEAIEICRNNSDIDLILMDIQMPEMNGLEATRQIRKFNKDVIIIAQTAYGLTGDRAKSLDAGCNYYLTKPINKSELELLIRKCFQKSQNN